MSRNTELYRKQIRLLYKRHSREQECALARAYNHGKGDPEAGRQLLYSILPLVAHIARTYEHCCRSGLEVHDLIQVGNRGAMRAVEKFEPRRQVRLTTYAGWWIRQGIIRELQAQNQVIRTPVLASGTFPRQARCASHGVYSLDTPSARQQSRQWLDDRHLPDEVAAQREAADHAQTALLYVTQRERRILELRYLHDWTLQQVGDEFRITRERVRQIEVRALRKARSGLICIVPLLKMLAEPPRQSPPKKKRPRKRKQAATLPMPPRELVDIMIGPLRERGKQYLFIEKHFGS